MSDGRVIDRLWRPSGRERDRLATHQPSRLPPHRGEQGGSFLFCQLLPAAARPSLSLPSREGTWFLSVSNTSALASAPSQGGKGGAFLFCPLRPAAARPSLSLPSREGTWFSIVGDTPAPTSPPSQGGTRGVFPILPAAPCHRKTLPVPPFEGGDLVSVG